MGFNLGKPNLRAEMEKDMKLIAEGQKTKEEVLKVHLEAMKNILTSAVESKDKMHNYLSKHLKDDGVFPKHLMTKDSEFANCPTCKYNKLVVRLSKADLLFIACNGYPKCKNTSSFPDGVEYLEKLTESCTKWSSKNRGHVNLFKLQFAKKYHENDRVSSILGGKDNGVFWLFKDWDSNLKSLILATRRITSKIDNIKVDEVVEKD